MTTLPEREPHQAREAAESFGENPERYDRTRPRYPKALIARIAAEATEVLDVGIGTGIAARQLRAAGCRVLGVEVDARMADFARTTGLEVEVASFEEWEARDRTFDAVVAGQTWHWIDPVAGAAKAARVLRPGGRVVLFWNMPEPPAELAEAFAEVYRRVLPEPVAAMVSAPAPDARNLLDKVADGIRAAEAFGEPEEWRFTWRHTYARDEWLEQASTSGMQAWLSPEQRRDLGEGLGECIDKAGGAIEVGYTTVAVTAKHDGPG